MRHIFISPPKSVAIIYNYLRKGDRLRTYNGFANLYANFVKSSFGLHSQNIVELRPRAYEFFKK